MGWVINREDFVIMSVKKFSLAQNFQNPKDRKTLCFLVCLFFPLTCITVGAHLIKKKKKKALECSSFPLFPSWFLLRVSWSFYSCTQIFGGLKSWNLLSPQKNWQLWQSYWPAFVINFLWLPFFGEVHHIQGFWWGYWIFFFIFGGNF